MNLCDEIIEKEPAGRGTRDLPPISAVLTLPALRTWKVAEAILFAM